MNDDHNTPQIVDLEVKLLATQARVSDLQDAIQVLQIENAMMRSFLKLYSQSERNR